MWEAAHAKLTTGEDECNPYSYRSETDRQVWERSHCGVEGKQKPPLHDLKAAIEVL